MTIPKILHFTWKTEDVPGDMGVYLQRWRDLHPDWEIRLWTDATMREFVAETYPAFLKAYESYPHNIQRADSFRYLVLNALGGVYSDLDVEPFRSIDELVDGLECFAGIEPNEHIGPDRAHSGAPFLVTNAFMGGVPGHPWYRQLVALLPQTAGIDNIFQSTGPGVTTGASLRMTRAERPVLILPQQWSPEIDGGQPCTSDVKLRALLEAGFDFAEVQGRFVAHRWMTSWVSWDKRHKWLAKPFHMMNAAKWAMRRLIYRDLNAVDIRDPLHCYFDQFPKPPETWPEIDVCVVAEDEPAFPAGLKDALAGLDYPEDPLAMAISHYPVDAPDEGAPETEEMSEAHWRMARWANLANRGAENIRETSGYMLFVDSRVTSIPPGALKAMIAADKPVVALGRRDANGEEADRSVFSYRWWPGLRTVYKIRGKDGLAEPERGQRDFLPDFKAFAQIALDGAGHSCILVRRDVLAAGVGFATEPYHLHLGGEGFALMARHKGFEVAGLTEWAVEAGQ